MTGQNENIAKNSFLSPGRTFALGFWLILLPSYFLFCALIKYFSETHTPFLDIIDSFGISMNRNFYFRIISPVILIGGPVLAFWLNLRALIKFKYGKGVSDSDKRLIKFPVKNAFICVVSALVILVFLLYGIKNLSG